MGGDGFLVKMGDSIRGVGTRRKGGVAIRFGGVMIRITGSRFGDIGRIGGGVWRLGGSCGNGVCRLYSTIRSFGSFGWSAL